MNEAHSRPDLADQLRRLLATVTGALRAEGWRGWLGGAMALVTWIRTRRERREAAAALEQFKGLIEAFLVLLEEYPGGEAGRGQCAAGGRGAGGDAGNACASGSGNWRPRSRGGDGCWSEVGAGRVVARLW